MKKNTNGSAKPVSSNILSHRETSGSTAILKKTNGKGKVQIDGSYPFEDKLNDLELLQILSALKNGDFKVRMPIDRVGINGKICDTLNEIISLNETLFRELTLARNTIGKQGTTQSPGRIAKVCKGFMEHGRRFH